MTKGWLPYYIRRIDSQGAYYEYSYLNEPLFTNLSEFNDIEFTSTKTFIYSPNSGLFSFNGSNWTLEASVNDGYSIASDADTIWLARSSAGPYFKWAAGSMTTGSASIKRSRSRNGDMWISGGDWDVIGSYIEGVGPTFHSPDTSLLLSWANHDFKFAHNSDTLYVAGDLGFSLAYNGFFVDTITPNNSINMPGSVIIEFEFDPQDNIWAVFGTGTTVQDSTTCVAYYERSLNEWTQVYNSSNSPIPFDNKWVTIEVDSSGNLWATDGRDIHVLKISNWPTWLDLKDKELTQIAIFPNPAEKLLHVEGIENGSVRSISFTDLQGKVLWTEKNPIISGGIDVSSLSSGCYLLAIETESGMVITKRWVKE